MINWLVRFKNPLFLIQIGFAIFTPILAYFGLTGADMTSWSLLGQTLYNAIMNPYVCFCIGVSVWNAINDPTTKGASDSVKALTYQSPQ